IENKLRPGDRIDTVRNLAKRYQVSVNTIGAAISILAREGLIDARPGRGMRVREVRDTRHVGVVLAMDVFASNVSYFWRRVPQQVIRGLREHGYRTRFYGGDVRPGYDDTDQAITDVIEDIDDERVRGLVLLWGG